VSCTRSINRALPRRLHCQQQQHVDTVDALAPNRKDTCRYRLGTSTARVLNPCFSKRTESNYVASDILETCRMFTATSSARVLNPRFLCVLASYDVASDIRTRKYCWPRHLTHFGPSNINLDGDGILRRGEQDLAGPTSPACMTSQARRPGVAAPVETESNV